jgi:hypothetical protein
MLAGILSLFRLLATAVGGLLAIYGRITAKKVIGA